MILFVVVFCCCCCWRLGYWCTLFGCTLWGWALSLFFFDRTLEGWVLSFFSFDRTLEVWALSLFSLSLELFAPSFFSLELVAPRFLSLDLVDPRFLCSLSLELVAQRFCVTWGFIFQGNLGRRWWRACQRVSDGKKKEGDDGLSASHFQRFQWPKKVKDTPRPQKSPPRNVGRD